ncbi:hypothetical protein [Planomicrobium sp. CPCC 101079]|uniref:hypothetical protein n=1 Tax=Planomicrobium sp. CPCC 101079 TaxID=2599618 RepID=UPI0011B4AE74|nr:hypothetical protein [Planomicrobium sp. CPCC 101079]TWT04607.1 hypothetical protein FQV28_08365 [Planomicrobium sp. CPCC 101079]
MSLRRLLIHSCTTVTPGQHIGETEYGKPIYKDVVKKNVPCRADLIQQTVTSDTYSTDSITKNMLFLGPDSLFDENTRFKEIRDKQGNVILEGSFVMEDSKPAYGKRRIHHHEITLKKESDSSG